LAAAGPLSPEVGGVCIAEVPEERDNQVGTVLGEVSCVGQREGAEEAPSDRRLAELILYVARVCEGDESFGSTKLNKILFLADFLAYRKLGASITGAEYQRLPFGPAPRRLKPVLEALVQSGAAAIRTQDRFGYEQKRPVALREPDLRQFTGEQIALLDQIIRILWGRTASDVSELSHGFIGWQLAEEGETIPYGLALYDPGRQLSQEGKRVVEELRDYATALLAGDAS
jgi:hypothetical protein